MYQIDKPFSKSQVILVINTNGYLFTLDSNTWCNDEVSDQCLGTSVDGKIETDEFNQYITFRIDHDTNLDSHNWNHIFCSFEKY